MCVCVYVSSTDVEGCVCVVCIQSSASCLFMACWNFSAHLVVFLPALIPDFGPNMLNHGNMSQCTLTNTHTHARTHTRTHILTAEFYFFLKRPTSFRLHFFEVRYVNM